MRSAETPWRTPVPLVPAVGRPRSDLTGILLVGGSSTRFGSPKSLAVVEGDTLAERGWRTLGAACKYRLAVGKGEEVLPFCVLADGVDERAPIHGLAAGLRAAPTDVVRRVLAGLEVAVVPLDPHVLVNVNTPEDLGRIRRPASVGR
jgi:molybdopterin-guanine dinucleotide biosynthesis protein A